MYYKDPRRQMIDQEQESMLELFRRAIPGIGEKAQIIYVEHNPYYMPGGTRVDLKEYIIEFPDRTSERTLEYHFTIGRHIIEMPARHELVLVLLKEVEGYKASATIKYKDTKDC
jgi:hypothetical protein